MRKLYVHLHSITSWSVETERGSINFVVAAPLPRFLPYNASSSPYLFRVSSDCAAVRFEENLNLIPKCSRLVSCSHDHRQS